MSSVPGSPSPTRPPYEIVDAERFDYTGCTIYQWTCKDGCDRGLLLSPARFCPECGGSGYVTLTVSREEEDID